MQRRDFLLQTALSTAAFALPRRLLAKAGESAPPRNVLVDWHSHFVSQAEIRLFELRKAPPRLLHTAGHPVAQLQNVDTASFAAGEPADFEASDLEARLRHLDANGISHQLLSQTVAMGLDATIPVNDLKPVFRAFNDELADVVRQHAPRFLGVAALPTGDPQWAAAELKRAHEELGLIGGALPLNAFATLEGARTLAPIFAEGQKHKSHFFVHRAPASARVPGQPPIVLPKDTEFARWTLISNAHLAAGGITLGLTDFLDPYPDVSVQVVMLAGFLPYLTDAILPAAEKAGIKDPIERIRRLYFDPGPYSRIGDWVDLAIRKIGADRIIFGSDYGVNGGARGDIAPALKVLDSALNPGDRRLIYQENSRILLANKGIVLTA
jgi:predicted TIM-barrel fold metal-dependent hydrolase